MEFRAEQPYAQRASALQPVHIHRQARIDKQINFNPVPGHRRFVPQGFVAGQKLRPGADIFLIAGQDLWLGGEINHPVHAIDNDLLTLLHMEHGLFHLTNHGNAQSPGHNRHMGCGAALLQNHSLQFFPVIIQKFGRPHILRHNNGIIR